ncbi:MAG: gamma-glutamyltransferase [Planctomycetota bacterium]|nr:gamma-glutamyltransferase [Planctomycetota bacterium]MDP6939046.1 gamma-glutamyltransferase [Planctomycetota bacterium]
MALATLVTLVFWTLVIQGQDRITGRSFATRSPVRARKGMAATSQPLATSTALQILRSGGHAVDAALAANAVLCLVEPTGAGLGGDLFAMVWDGTEKKLYGVNGSGRSPRSLTLDRLQQEGSIPPRGPLSVSVPGCVDGWSLLHERFGRVPFADLLAPAIDYAREGFPVSDVIAHEWERNVQTLSAFPTFAETFTLSGRAPRAGEIFSNHSLARTLEILAQEGRDAFYEGQLAEQMVAHMQKSGGFLCMADLSEHRGEWVTPLSTSYRGVNVWELPPNGQGIAALQMLNVLEHFDLEGMGWASADHLHVLIEAKKLAFEDRAKFYADPEFAQIPIDQLTSKEYAAERAQAIDMGRARRCPTPGDPAALEAGDTVYLSVADKEGNMVSLIQSNYRGMGSGVTPPGLGFVLQNRGELFSLDPSHANVFAPGKRPFHTIMPGFSTCGSEAWLCFGVMGGATQPQGHVQVLTNQLDFRMNVQEAGDAPRVIHRGSSCPTGEAALEGGRVSIESGVPTRVSESLVRRGHYLDDASGQYGGYQAIEWDSASATYCGASESRKDGHAAGY